MNNHVIQAGKAPSRPLVLSNYLWVAEICKNLPTEMLTLRANNNKLKLQSYRCVKEYTVI